jgi:hypothetical protein
VAWELSPGDGDNSHAGGRKIQLENQKTGS